MNTLSIAHIGHPHWLTQNACICRAPQV